MRKFAPLVVDEKTVADMIGISVSTLQKMRSTKGGGPSFIKIGNRVRYRVSDLEAYLDSLAKQQRNDREQALADQAAMDAMMYEAGP